MAPYTPILFCPFTLKNGWLYLLLTTVGIMVKIKGFFPFYSVTPKNLYELEI